MPSPLPRHGLEHPPRRLDLVDRDMRPVGIVGRKDILAYYARGMEQFRHGRG